MYELLGINIVFAALLTINALATLAAAALGRLLKQPLLRCTARTRAEILFTLRIGPPATALIATVAFLIPSYLIYEPHATTETVTIQMAVIAIASAFGLVFAVWRGLRSWLATRSLLKKWLAMATPVNVEAVDVPAFTLPLAFPIIAVVGSLRPRLFIAAHVLQRLTKDELIAAMAHEYGHLAARDNFKRSLIRASRAALLIFPCGRSLDRAWSEASEAAADEHAAQKSASVALNLASALVTIAKMIPTGQQQGLPTSVSTFLNGDEEPQGVKSRVRRLLELAASDSRLVGTNAPIVRLAPWVVLSACVVAAIALETRVEVLASVHNVLEHFVAALS